MIRQLAAAALLAAAAAVPAHAADAPQVAQPECGPVPRVPGKAMRTDDFAMKRFKRDIDHYGDCMKAYVDEHQALAKANQEAANAAADQYNKAVKSINDDLKEE